MRYIIYGAGGIGSIMGGHLARTGHDVILISRSGHVSVINNNGLRLITPTGIYVLRIPVVTNPSQIDFTTDDVIFLCMKGQDTELALKDLKKVAKDMPVFCFQNGVRNEEIAIRYFPSVYGVMVRVGAVYLTDGEVIARRDPPGWYIIGRYPEGTDELTEAVAEELRTAGYFIKTTADVMPYKWGKLMSNLNNAVGAITNGERESTRPIYNAVFEEAQAIVQAAGIKWISQEQVARDWPEITAPLHGQLNTEAQSSTWQSLARHQGSVETEFLNGEIVRVAKKLGLQAPINEKLVEISQEMAANHEPPGKYTPVRLSEILELDNSAR
ncbi:ketopantoate reductase family protein [Chloroflexota bacterium]